MESLSLPDVHINFRPYIKNTCMNETSKNTNEWNPSNLRDLASLNWERNRNCDDNAFCNGFCVCVCACMCFWWQEKETEHRLTKKNNPDKIQWLYWNSKKLQIFTIRIRLCCADVIVWWGLNYIGFRTSAVLPHVRNCLPHFILSNLLTDS